jgi:photosystem II stability/assembly factor-like uncharacterized protein
MRGDFSRVSFRPENHFSGVLLQQGRVQLDAEFNEHVAIEAYRDHATARDVIGRAGAPIDGGGFAITVASRLRGVSAGDDAWAVGEDGTLLRSTTGTGQWTIEPVPPETARLNAVDVVGVSGWAVGDGAAILRLDGESWTREPAPAEVTADLHGVYAAQDGAWAVGSAGTVLSWTGTEWEQQAQNADVTATLRAVHFVGARGIAVGDGGTILATDDRGATWTAQSVPEGSGDLHGVFLADAQHAWAVGTQGTVLFFDDTAWAHQAIVPGVTAALRAVVFASASEGMAVGDGGIALEFANGAWQHQSTGVDVDLLALAALPGGGVLAVGDNIALTRAGPDGPWQAAPAMPARDGALGKTLAISAGDIYVEGIRCENEHTVSLNRQPEPLVDPDGFSPATPGTYGVFLCVQEQLLSATEREELREVALGGPDSATRTRTVWQAGLVELDDGDDDEPTCADVVSGAPADPPRGLLRARARPAPISGNSCIVPPNGGYRRLENQLYRVEIHDGSEAGAATYTWSRENGSVIARLEDLSADPAKKTVTAQVSDLGRDAMLGFGPEQLVELTDESRLLRAEPGVLLEIQEPADRRLVLANPGSLAVSMADFPVNPIVRCWDGRGTVEFGKWIELEDGVCVEFAEGPNGGDAFRTGDYWTIPARTLSGRVEWPHAGGVPLFEERHGPRRYTAPLAIANVDANGVWSGVRDCRNQFPPLTNLVSLYYVGGDGQQATPPVPLGSENRVRLDRPLEVGVVNGGTPMVGAIVDFEVLATAGSGKVAEPGGTFADNAAIVTDAFGIATCEWQVDGATRTQAVEARFRDPLGQSPPQVIRFNAQLSAAEWVAYDGSGCSTLAAGTTVDAAIKTMARTTRIFPLAGSGEDVLPGESVDIKVLVADGCGPVDGATVAFTRGDRGSGTIDQLQATTVNGVASCRWTPDNSTPTQDLTATLTGVPGPGVLHVPDVTRFVANLNLASDTAYTPPERCREMDGIRTVQAALDALILLPRLYHLRGHGVGAFPDERVTLEVGVVTDCGIDQEPRIVRFTRLEGDGELEGTDNGHVRTSNATASCVYRMGAAALHVIEAELLREPDGTYEPPIFFTITRLHRREGQPLLTLRLAREVLADVEDHVGRWLYEGGSLFDANGAHVGAYTSTMRTFPTVETRNSSMLTLTLFFVGPDPPDTITVQGAHSFNTGGQTGSVSAASAGLSAFIGQSFVREGEQVTIGESEPPV